jgi:enamine deaminase RidA (YjgF/YER057c/UK114 family)
MVRGGQMIYLSGQIALDPDRQLVGKEDLRAQIIQVFKNIQTALAAAGATFEDVLKLTYYIVDYKPEDRFVIREVRGQFLSSENPPASTLIGVQSLALPDLLIEIEAVAVVD